MKKVDSKTGSTPEGSATLAKAQFTVRYYDTTDAWSLSTDYATRNAAAKKTWVYETAEDGTVRMQHDLPKSGDDVFRDSFGDVTLPLGTYVLEETDPPTGYLLPNYQKRTYIEVIKPVENGTDESIHNYGQEVYQPDDLGWAAWTLPGKE